MKRRYTLYIILLLVAVLTAGEALGAQPRKPQRRTKAKTTKVVRKKSNAKAKPKAKARTKTKKVVRAAAPKPRDPRLDDPDYDPFLQCEDTCGHVHGIDLSRYQGDVFWETVGENTKMAYVYLKATEGGDRIDPKFERNINLAHRYGLKVGSYHFFRPKTPLKLQLDNFTAQCLPGEQDLIPMIDVETLGGLTVDQFCDSLLTFLRMVEVAYHQKPLVYTFRNFYNWHLVGKLDDYQLMIAMYLDAEPVLADERDITMWQYTGKGRIVGINGYVDKSRFLGRHGLREIRFRHH